MVCVTWEENIKRKDKGALGIPTPIDQRAVMKQPSTLSSCQRHRRKTYSMLCHAAKRRTSSWEMNPSSVLNAIKRSIKRRMENYLLLNFLLQGGHR